MGNVITSFKEIGLGISKNNDSTVKSKHVDIPLMRQ